MQAVAISTKSLDLVRSLKGTEDAQIIDGPNGHPGSYCVISDDPGVEAVVWSIDDLFDSYEFVGPETDDAFRPIVPLPEGPCPRCGGDHSWCQSVQPGEFGPE